jgi:hypothetical protein
MAISFVAASAVVTGANPTLAVPAGYAKNDLLLIITTGSATPTTPTGWTQLAAQGASQFITVLYKYAAATEASVAVTLTGASSKSAMLAYRGAGAFQLSASFLTGTSTAPSTSTTTTTYANDYVVSIYANLSGAARTWTANVSTTSRVNSSTTTTINGLLIADELQVATGVTTARAATLSLSSAWSGLQIAFIPTRTVYWVGGNGTWTIPVAGITGANWADSSNGVGSKIIPTQNDAVIVDSSSGSPTITLSSVPACASLTTTGATCTISSIGTLQLNGSMTLSATTTWSATGVMTILGTGTVTTNAVSLASPITIDGVSQTVTLGSALTTTGLMTLTNGTLALGGFDANCLTFTGTGSAARGVTFGANYVNITSTATATVLTLNNTALFTPSGAGGFKLTGAAASGITRTAAVGSTNGSVATAPNLFVAAGAVGSIFALSATSWVQDLNFTGFSGTFAPSSTTYDITGSLTVVSGMTWTTGTGSITFSATSAGKTITTAGKTLRSIVFNGVGGGWTLQDAMIANDVTLTNGTFNANNFNLSADNYTLTGGAVTMGSGTWTITGTSTGWSRTGTTVTANTSTIAFSTTSATGIVFAGGGATYNNLSLTGVTGTGTLTISGANTFNTLSSSRTGIYTVTLPANTTTTVGTWSIAGTSVATNLVTLNSSTAGTQATLSVASGTVNPGYATIQDSNATGGATFTATNAANLGNNTGWFGSTQQGLYWVGGGGSWTSLVKTNWSNVSGGTGGYAAPVQYTNVFFDGSSGSGTVATNSTAVANSVDTTGSSFTFTGSTTAPTIYGSFTLSATTVWITAAGVETPFVATTTGKTITTNGVTLGDVLFAGTGGGWTIQDNLTCATFDMTRGAFNANNFNITASNFSSQGSADRTLTMGSGTWTLNNTTSGWSIQASNVTFNANTSTIVLANPNTGGSVTKSFTGGGLTYYNLQLGSNNTYSTATYTIAGSNTFNTISSNQTAAYTITLTAGTTNTVTNWTATGISGNVLTLNSSTPGTQATLALTGGGIVSGIDYLSIQDINFTPAPSGTQKYVWYMGSNSTFSTNVTGGALLTSDTTKIAYHLLTGTSWTIPNDWNSSSNNVYLVAGGGGGAGSVVTAAAGNHVSGSGGGGGGFTTATNVSLTPGGSAAYAIGAAGTAGTGSTSASTAGAGGATTFNSGAYTTTGGGGASGTSTTTTAGTAGTGATFNGGAGGVGIAAANVSSAGGGGGGSGGIDGAGVAGGAAVTTTPGAGGAGDNGVKRYISIGTLTYGNGGDGSPNTIGTAGGLYGAGGGGAGTVASSATVRAGGVGTQGAIFILYSTAAASNGNFFFMFA